MKDMDKTKALLIEELMELRRRAEARLADQDQNIEEFATLSSTEATELLHDLRTHQIELEMQNEELRQAQEKLRQAQEKLLETQEKLLETQERYVDLYDFAPVSCLTLSETNLILEANLTSAELLDVDRSALLNNSALSRFIVDEDQDIYYTMRRQLLETRVRQVCELRMKRKNGDAFFARIDSGLVKGLDADDVRFRITLSDITERKQAEDALQKAHDELEEKVKTRTMRLQLEIAERKQAEEVLRESEQRFRSVADSVAYAIITADVDGNIETWNNGAEILFGYNVEEVLGQPLTILIPERYRDAHRAGLKRFISTGESHVIGKTVELHGLKNDGTEFPLELSLSTWANEKGTFFSGIIRDTTEHQRLEEEVRKNQNLESLGVLAGGIAHDFNNILTGVIGSLTLLEMLVDKDSDAHQIAVEGKRAADRTRDLTQQLLTFAKGGAPVKEVASIETLIRETTELSLSGSNTKPDYHLAEDLHSVNVDQGQIGQVIQNLVLNADQAMPEGGTLKISAENIELSAQDQLPLAAGNYVKVSIEDQGIGMSAKVMAKIFDPYYTTKPSGHGLGLSITHSIVQRHDGHMAVHSEQNVGTTFEFYLPALLELAPTTTEPEHELARGTGRILLMDDEEMIHTTVTTMLKMLGYEVEGVYDGEEALQAYQAAQETDRPFDLVIVDLTIPGGMGGQEAVGKLHEIDPKARVIVSSGYANDPVVADYAQYGFADKVTKPVDMQELAETVKRVLAGGR